jgi:hypothetical protein
LTHESDVSRRVVKMDGRKVDMCHCNSRLGYNRENRARRAIWVVLSLIVDYYSWRYRRHLRRLWRVGESVSTRLRSGDARIQSVISSRPPPPCTVTTPPSPTNIKNPYSMVRYLSKILPSGIPAIQPTCKNSTGSCQCQYL